MNELIANLVKTATEMDVIHDKIEEVIKRMEVKELTQLKEAVEKALLEYKNAVPKRKAVSYILHSVRSWARVKLEELQNNGVPLN